MLTACAAIGVAGAGAARADFTETTCDGGPATEWSTPAFGPTAFGSEMDECGSGGELHFLVDGAQMAAGSTATAGIVMPQGEVLTGVSVTYSTLPSSGSQALVYVGTNGIALASGPTGQQDATYTGQLSDANAFGFTLWCNGASACSFPDYDPLRVGAITLTIHDTGSPTVAAAGGSLGAPGTYSGLQTIGYTAQDAGSGVATVAARLGSTVVASAQSTCQSFELSPCPHSTSGTFTIDTTSLRNGSYPVTLTATDESGDPATITVGTVRIRNSGTVSVSSRRHRGRVSARLITGWNWGHRPYTRVRSLRFVRLPAHARVTLVCRGRACPRSRWSSGSRVQRFERRLAGVRFRAGDRLTFTIRAPHRRAERIRVTIRDGRIPTGRLLR